MKKIFVLVAYFTFSIFHFSFSQQALFQKGYFQYPIYAGQKGSLAGGIGDLRTNHFHAGIDVRTQAREGLPVQAAAEGYISKIKTQTNGYGNVLFIKHPNGLTTVYGHLQRFNDEIANYIRQKQYEWKTFEIEVNPDKAQFVVQKGELIGLSGNSGGSAGPHLHFEIRDANDNYLNPLFFGFDEIEDNIPPFFQSLAFRPLTIKSRVNQAFELVIAKPVRQKDGTYTIQQPIKATGTIGLELMAFDFMNGVQFRNGVNCVEIKMDGQEVFVYNMTSFPSWNTRDYNNLIDYATEQKTGLRYLKCYNPDGNNFNLSKTNQFQGKLSIADTLVHEVEISLFDSYENVSVLKFEIKGEVPSDWTSQTSEYLQNPTYLKSEIQENTLKISALGLSSAAPDAQFFTRKNIQNIKPAYLSNNEVVYLFDLNSTLPDSVKVGTKALTFNFQKRILPNRVENYKGGNNDYEIRFGNQSIFDTLYLDVMKFPDRLTINDGNTPLRDAIGVRFEPEIVIDKPLKTHIYKNENGRMRFVGGKWQQNSIEFTTRELGNFVLAVDTILPYINIKQSNKKRIEARISDNLSGIDKFNAFVNNEWVLMNYDYKRATIWSEKLVDSLDFEGKLRIEVTDRAGNTAILQKEIAEPIIVTKTTKKNVKNRRKSPSVRGKRPKRKKR